MQIATWNVNSLKVRLPQVLSWLKLSQCSVLALQEIKIANCAFPFELFQEYGYYTAVHGQKGYNGVALIAKYPIEDVIHGMPNYQDPQSRVISATINGLRIICVYVVNGEAIESTKYQYKLTWCEHLYRFITNGIKHYKNLLVMGDFNIAPEDVDVYDPLLWRDKVLCSVQERLFWRKLLDLGLCDSFRLLMPDYVSYTWWDYRNYAFRRNFGMRIDHILVSDNLKHGASKCFVDINPRKNERPSDHAPLILYLNPDKLRLQ